MGLFSENRIQILYNILALENLTEALPSSYWTLGLNGTNQEAKILFRYDVIYYLYCGSWCPAHDTFARAWPVVICAVLTSPFLCLILQKKLFIT